ncbi:hypothetical protein EI976_20635 [Bacillus licheniformis]|uniref:hypothetical protein n=1 Tax=Bacillus TaxID=1386 RepID=UPI0002FF246C|nr:MULTISPECIES: hypothetical protein [Bacillus]KAA0807288.1 hypothetical protein EI978_21095 [Bacillus licheniformis]KAA0819747.1 hypothetical protein EI976_20635 [Bacillus licheniformis]KAA0820749.1 hypothetical protein EI973_21300 [Bacillus licheniformis]MBC9090139.1 hypothetical protein [Bacillus sp. Y1]NBB46319.1 hypothetical protein [Bacillus sp. y1(2019)]
MSEVKKPVITKEQAEALDLMRKANYDEYILMAACDGILGGELEDLDIMTLAAALINGYEVEKTPEEKVREFYESHGGSPSAEERKAAIRETLYKLGIKIEGVNA